MTPDQFILKIKEYPERMKIFVDTSGPVILGKTARDFFRESFRKEGFTNAEFVPWQEVQRRGANGHKIAKGAAGTRKILTGDTGDLGESIEYTPESGRAIIHSDLPYAKPQNEGTPNAGRNHNVTLPARQFVGDSEMLDAKIKEEIERKLNNLFK